MRDERAEFVRQIVSHPDDVTTRLVYADWLDETGVEHDAAIAGWIRGTVDSERSDLDLWGALAMFGNSPSDMGLPMTAGRCIIRAGFIEHVELTLEQFWKVAKKLFRCHPIKSVYLAGRYPQHISVQTFTWLVRSDGELPRERPEPSMWLPNHYRHFLKANRNQKRAQSRSRGYHRYTYASATDAIADLSAASVRYGRWLCGLPKLELMEASS